MKFRGASGLARSAQPARPASRGHLPSIPPAQAQPAKVFVAAQGSDSNPCTFAQPCLSFQHAHDTVAAGGVIDVLGPADYGVVTITKAISIQGHGFAGLAVTSGNGITINAGASDKVSLRGLLIDGVGSGSNGLDFFLYGPGAVQFAVSDSDFSNNGADGVLVDLLHRTYNLVNVMLRNVNASNNVSTDIAVVSGGVNTFVWLTKSTITGNGVGLAVTCGSGTINSFGDNSLAGNFTNGQPVDGSPCGSPIPLR